MRKYPVIGTWGLVSAIATVGPLVPQNKGPDFRAIKRRLLKTPAHGQFVGIAHRQEAIRESGHGVGSDDPGCTREVRLVLVYHVKFGLRSKPLEVLPSDFETLAIQADHLLPWHADLAYEKQHGTERMPVIGSAAFPAPDGVYQDACARCDRGLVYFQGKWRHNEHGAYVGDFRNRKRADHPPVRATQEAIAP